MFPYLIYLATLLGIYLIAVLSYSIPVGYTGLLNLGQVGLLAVGAYTAAVLTTRGVQFLVALVAAGVVTGFIGWLLALPARRIRGDYYALVTLGFTFVVSAVLLNWTSLTGGPFGLSGMQRPAGFTEPMAWLILVCGVLLVVALVIHRLVNSPFGQALEAVRDDELVAESLGKPVGKLKVVASAVAAVGTGLAGALLAHFLQFINPQLFWLDNAVWLLTALVVGGLASFRGAILGTALLFVLFEPLRFVPLPPGLVGSLRLITFASLLLAVVLVRPRGLFGRAQLEQ